MKFKKDWREQLSYKTQLDINDVNERNVAFHDLSREDRKKEVALDSISLIASKSIIGAHGCYWGSLFHNIKSTTSSAAELQSDLLYFPPMQPFCEVCQRGAMMLSLIRVGNNLDPSLDDLDSGNISIQDTFTNQELSYMENLYEGFFDWNHDSIFRKTTEMLLQIGVEIVQTGNCGEEYNLNYTKLVLQ